MSKEIHFPAEWEPQSGIMLTWPELDTDWSDNLDLVSESYFSIAKEIAAREKLIVLCRSSEQLKNRFDAKIRSNIDFIELNYNDTWIRDYGPITILKNKVPVLLDFKFNGWGLKFPANLDNQVNKQLYKTDILNDEVLLVNRKDFVLEGGSIETNGRGTLLVTQKCLLSANRNEHLSKIEIEEELRQTFGADRILWLKYGYLEGDDTDGHVDTLARFIDESTIMYATTNEDDTHFGELKKMENELMQLKTSAGTNFNLIPMPLPTPVYDTEGRRLPATYLNFLFINGAVLVPVYNNKSDTIALELFASIFKNLAIVPVNCLPLLNQNGSLHCATMQLPAGCL